MSLYLCSANNCVTCGRKRDNCTVPFESSDSVAAIISFISFSDGTQPFPIDAEQHKYKWIDQRIYFFNVYVFYRPKWRRIVPISRTSTVLLFWWSNIRNASPIRFSKSVVAAVQQQKEHSTNTSIMLYFILFVHLCRTKESKLKKKTKKIYETYNIRCGGGGSHFYNSSLKLPQIQEKNIDQTSEWNASA